MRTFLRASTLIALIVIAGIIVAFLISSGFCRLAHEGPGTRGDDADIAGEYDVLRSSLVDRFGDKFVAVGYADQKRAKWVVAMGDYPWLTSEDVGFIRNLFPQSTILQIWINTHDPWINLSNPPIVYIKC